MKSRSRLLKNAGSPPATRACGRDAERMQQPVAEPSDVAAVLRERGRSAVRRAPSPPCRQPGQEQTGDDAPERIECQRPEGRAGTRRSRRPAGDQAYAAHRDRGSRWRASAERQRPSARRDASRMPIGVDADHAIQQSGSRERKADPAIGADRLEANTADEHQREEEEHATSSEGERAARRAATEGRQRDRRSGHRQHTRRVARDGSHLLLDRG